MKLLRPISILASALMLTASAVAQVSLTPPGAETPAASKPASKPKAKPPAAAKKPEPAGTAKPAAPLAAPTATVTPAPPPDDPNVDLVFGAYQRGYYKTAFDLATKRYNIGMLNTIDYLTNQNNLFTARINQLIAQYDYVFRTKVLEYYKGLGIKL